MVSLRYWLRDCYPRMAWLACGIGCAAVALARMASARRRQEPGKACPSRGWFLAPPHTISCFERQLSCQLPCQIPPLSTSRHGFCTSPEHTRTNQRKPIRPECAVYQVMPLRCLLAPVGRFKERIVAAIEALTTHPHAACVAQPPGSAPQVSRAVVVREVYGGGGCDGHKHQPWCFEACVRRSVCSGVP
jgi:hypothetical protein